MSKGLMALFGAGVLLASAHAAQADIVYNLSNATLSSMANGGTEQGVLTGSFTTNDARTAVIAYDIIASAFGSFAGFEYTPATAPVSSSELPSLFFRLDSPGNVNELQFYFPNGLTVSGGTMSTGFSYEHEPSGGNRFLNGSVVAAAATDVPEPASLALLGLGAAGLLAARRRRAA